MWGLSIQALQALGNWSLAVAGVAGVVAAAAVLLSALTSARVADLTRANAEQALAEAKRHAAQIQDPPQPLLVAASAAPPADPVAASAPAEAEAPPAAVLGVAAFARRANAFAALVQGHTPELALVVGHGPGAHAAGQVMRQALRSAGVQVRWCRLKPSADADHAGPAEGLTVYAGADGAGLLEALTRAGFKAELAPAGRADPGLPSPAIYFAAARKPASEDLALCNPVVGPPA